VDCSSAPTDSESAQRLPNRVVPRNSAQSSSCPLTPGCAVQSWTGLPTMQPPSNLAAADYPCGNRRRTIRCLRFTYIAYRLCVPRKSAPAIHCGITIQWRWFDVKHTSPRIAGYFYKMPTTRQGESADLSAFMVTSRGRVTALRTERGQHPPSVCCSRLSTLPRSEVATHEFDIFLIPQCLFRV
jgi:hypothetical protein